MAASSVTNVLVNRLKGSGFWHVETEGVIRRSIHDLTDRGFSEEEACELIGKLWTTAVGEYGE